jgi:hypothetical protein
VNVDHPLGAFRPDLAAYCAEPAITPIVIARDSGERVEHGSEGLAQWCGRGLVGEGQAGAEAGRVRAAGGGLLGMTGAQRTSV